jgi:HSP20 family protein
VPIRSLEGKPITMTLAPFFSWKRRGGGQLATVPAYQAYQWDPLREIDEINTRYGQLLQTLAGGSGRTPPVDVEETEDSYLIDIDLPNVDPQNVTIELRGEELRIAGTFQQQGRGGIPRRQNRQTGEFEYVVDLPSDIDAERVEAAYNNGVFTVKVGKTKDLQPRRIEIRGGPGKQQLEDRQQSAQPQSGARGSTQQKASAEAQSQSARQQESQDKRHGQDDRTSGR